MAEIKAQTLIVWGRNDRFVPMDAGLRLLSGIAGSELHIFATAVTGRSGNMPTLSINWC